MPLSHLPDRHSQYEEKKLVTFPKIPLRLIIPNLITLVALSLGLTSIRLTFEHKYGFSIACILFAGFLDGIDGKLARLLKGTSKFGEELDSLADFVSFGCAPALLLYAFSLYNLKALGWIAALLFAIAMCLRLARFNATLNQASTEKLHKKYFVGVPAPAGAVLVMLPVELHLLGLKVPDWFAPFILLYVLTIGGLVISKIPTFSSKIIENKITHDMVIPICLLTVVLFGCFFSYPMETTVFLTFVYLGTIIMSSHMYKKELLHDKKPEHNA